MNHLELCELPRDRAETIGRMTPGMVDDTNNVLTLVLSSLEIEAEAPTVQPLAATVRDSVERVAAMYRQFLAYARRGEQAAAQPVDLSAAASDLRAVLDLYAGRNIRINYVLQTSANHVAISRGAFDQVLINLIANARDAMPDGGTIDLIVRDGFERGARTTLVEVTDDGHGMTPYVMHRIFEPFYTTKAESEGTGLGLHVVSRIVKGAGGRVDVASMPGEGSRFTLTFPAVLRAVGIAYN